MTSLYTLIKRIQDIVLATLVLVILFPLLLILSVIIFIDDPHGSPVFSQMRVGKEGKLFRMYKFRSMCVDAEEKLADLYQYNEMDGPAFKIKNDPRITRVGHIIRKTCIDELPQLWNILLGQMSFVGPRPALPQEVERYDEYQRQRLKVVPGLTCYWQIQPHRNEMNFSQWVEWDIKYINEQSLLTDWIIILSTIRVVVLCMGDYRDVNERSTNITVKH